MTRTSMLLAVWLFLLPQVFCPSTGWSQEAHVHHEPAQVQAVTKPTVFLDKSPRVVAYQLKRLSTAQLLLVDRLPTDAIYAPVYEALLDRNEVEQEVRWEAIVGLATLRNSSPSVEILSSLERIKPDLAQQGFALES